MRTTTDQRGPREAGFSLVEYAVSMGIFAVVIAITISGVTLMARDTVKTTNLSTTTDQTRQAFTKLDRQVRYASSVNFPGKNAAGNRWYIEFLGLEGDGTPTCYQWRVDTVTHQLEFRQWLPNAATLPATFTTVASNISNDTTTTEAPFTLLPANTTSKLQAISLNLLGERTSSGGTNKGAVSLQSSMSARNSSVSSSQSNEDTNPADGNSDNPICKFGSGVNRP
jgi:hypothetical protein